tara:strand:+ start:386 stop:610 length:225 start_codon:yes stop_codon:yes gene_type:complete
MTNDMQKGDLVWIPQDTRLHWLREDSNKRYLVTLVPRTAVIYEEKDRCYDVFMDGDMWTINKNNTYYLEGEYAR